MTEAPDMQIKNGRAWAAFWFRWEVGGGGKEGGVGRKGNLKKA